MSAENNDDVNHPSHYNRGRVETALVLDVLWPAEQWLSHALTYVSRAPFKGTERKDVDKAIWCARRAAHLVANRDGPERAELCCDMGVAQLLVQGLVEPLPQPLRDFAMVICLRPDADALEEACDELAKAYNRVND